MQIHIIRNCAVHKGTKHTELNIKPSPREMTAALPQVRSKILCCALRFSPVSAAGGRDRAEGQHLLFQVCWSSLQTETKQALGSPWRCAWMLHSRPCAGASTLPFTEGLLWSLPASWGGVCKQESSCTALGAASCCAGSGVTLPISCLPVCSAGSLQAAPP